MLASLARYCDQLSRLHPELVPDDAWSSVGVKFIFEINESGGLENVIPLEGKKGSPRMVPVQAGRTSGVSPYLLCDNSSYFLGVDSKGKPKRSRDCFRASRDLHETVLGGIDSPCAKAVVSFFQTWNPDDAISNEAVMRVSPDVLEGGNIVFALRSEQGFVEVISDPLIVSACKLFAAPKSNPEDEMTCLVTGSKGPIARTHPQFRGIPGAQSSGAALVSFNCSSFESYGQRGGQGRNAPVSVGVARSYGIALDHLLHDPGHCFRLGGTTVVFWSEKSDELNSAAMSDLLCLRRYDERSKGDDDQDARLERAVGAVMGGRTLDGDILDMKSPFYLLGLSPNRSRLAVRFFCCDEFGSVVGNVRAFYEETAIAHARFAPSVLSPFAILRSVENKNSKTETVLSQLSAPFMRSVLEGSRYPEALFSNILIRIRATHIVDRPQAAFIRAYLIRNVGKGMEEVSMGLDERRDNPAYVLGRMFSMLEQIQEVAHGGRSTIAERYLNSACATPASTFPMLLRLATAHLSKAEREKPGLAHVLRADLTAAMSMIESYPRTLGLVDQGEFFLGYYHQRQARFEPKASSQSVVSGDSE